MSALTFSDKAACEMLGRLEKQTNTSDLTISTFHAVTVAECQNGRADAMYVVGAIGAEAQNYILLWHKADSSMVKIAGEPLVILLVEDNEAHAELVLRSMKDNRVANIIYFADDGEKALDFLFHRGPYKEMITSPRPNLILLDLRLPRVDGLEVLKTIKETPNLMQIPVVILTSSDAETDIARSYKYHANSYVVKPLEFKKFTQLMNDIGGYWLGWNTVPLHDLDKEIPVIENKEHPLIKL